MLSPTESNEPEKCHERFLTSTIPNLFVIFRQVIQEDAVIVVKQCGSVIYEVEINDKIRIWHLIQLRRLLGKSSFWLSTPLCLQ